MKIKIFQNYGTIHSSKNNHNNIDYEVLYLLDDVNEIQNTRRIGSPAISRMKNNHKRAFHMYMDYTVIQE